MRRRMVGFIFLSLLPLLTNLSLARAATRCGANPADAAALAQVEATVAAMCDCCSTNASARRLACVVRTARRAASAGDLRLVCIARVVGDSIDACPLGADATGAPCRTCNADADC